MTPPHHGRRAAAYEVAPPAAAMQAHLRAIHEQLKVWSPYVAAALLTPAGQSPRLVVAYGDSGPRVIEWSDGLGCHWTSGPQAGEPVADQGRPDETGKAIARALGAPVRRP